MRWLNTSEMESTNIPQYINIQNNNFCYCRQGSGETVLFLHGITTYSFIWNKIIPFFANNYDAIAIDLLGCGNSDKPLDQNISLKRQAHLIKEFCDRIGVYKCHLVCHDVGGGIGQIMAVNYPELVENLILMNTVAYNFWPVQPIIAMRTPIIKQIAMTSLDYGLFELIIKRGLHHKNLLNDELMESFHKPMKTSEGRKGFLHFAKCLDNTNLTEIEKELQNLSMPVLILRGKEDVYLNESISQHLHSQIKNSELEIIEEAGHYIQIDAPKTIAIKIIIFISR